VTSFPSARGPRRSRRRCSRPRGSGSVSPCWMTASSIGSNNARPRVVARWCAKATRTTAPVDVTPPGFDARTRVHEYGGGAYTVHRGDRLLLEPAGRPALSAARGTRPRAHHAGHRRGPPLRRRHDHARRPVVGSASASATTSARRSLTSSTSWWSCRTDAGWIRACSQPAATSTPHRGSPRTEAGSHGSSGPAVDALGRDRAVRRRSVERSRGRRAGASSPAGRPRSRSGIR
jgi:hypothetical protein